MRGTSTQRGLGTRQKAWREIILAHDPMCRGCERAPSLHADHIVPRKPGAEDWSEANGQGLCAPCHSYKTAVEQRDPFFGIRLREEGAKVGAPAPSGWRALKLFGGDQ
jgi:5-methylcytosine-specific restriction endonuclease McrA